MIAKLSDKPFGNTTFSRKIDYNINKIKEGKAELLYSSMNAENLNSFQSYATDVIKLNDNVLFPFHEVMISLPEGEQLDNDKFIALAQEYIMRMGLSDTAYAIVRHVDTKKEHIHVLFTTVQEDGKHISDSFIKLKSQRISRELEKEYGLRETIYNEFNNEPLALIKSREYYFHKALVKGLKSYDLKPKIDKLIDIQKLGISSRFQRTNENYQLLLGDNLYEEIGSLLEGKKLFRPLFKDEILQHMETAYKSANSFDEYKNDLHKSGVYIRFLSDKGSSKYVYGLKDSAIYFNDKSFPLKYRYGKLSFNVNRLQDKGLDPNIANSLVDVNLEEGREGVPLDFQKHIIYNVVFTSLNKAKNYNDLKKILIESNVSIIEHSNTSGIYGLSFNLNNESHIFKASDISRKLSYKSIIGLFEKEDISLNSIVNNSVIIQSMKEDLNYIDFNGPTGYHPRKDDDEMLLSGKKKKYKKRPDRRIE